MIGLLKAAGRFFKMWFLPLPAHDYYEALERRREQSAANEGDTTDPSIKERREPLRIETEEVYKEANAQSAQAIESTDGSATSPPDDVPAIESQSNQGPDFSHLVKPPEGSESRTSRGAADFNDESDHDDNTEATPEESESESMELTGEQTDTLSSESSVAGEEESDISGVERR